MYFIPVLLLVLIFQVASVTAEATLSRHTVSMIFLIGRWFVFWAVAIRRLITRARQVVQPQFTAEEIFGIHDRGSFAIVREAGFANSSIGILGICSIFRIGWIVPAAASFGSRRSRKSSHLFPTVWFATQCIPRFSSWSSLHQQRSSYPATAVTACERASASFHCSSKCMS
jgi:hypothetical protein